MSLPRIGLCLGDPGGIGPEVTFKALLNLTSLPSAEYIIFTYPELIDFWSNQLNLDINPLLSPSNTSQKITFTPVSPPQTKISLGQPSAANGDFSFRAFTQAIEQARQGKLDAVVTGPISKYSWSLAKISWRGHTEYLNHLYPQAIMSFWSKPLKVALFSHHLPLHQVPPLITRENLINFFQTLHQAISPTKFPIQKYLVAGLNPHAGEQGLLGEEEIKELIPAIQVAQKAGLPLEGPFPPDIVCRQALHQENTMVIALYHDQGLIAFKLVAFTEGVNITLGLPFIRTSPDHGTAFDIAGQGLADPTSMQEAIKWAYKLISNSPDNAL